MPDPPCGLQAYQSLGSSQLPGWSLGSDFCRMGGASAPPSAYSGASTSPDEEDREANVVYSSGCQWAALDLRLETNRNLALSLVVKKKTTKLNNQGKTHEFFRKNQTSGCGALTRPPSRFAWCPSICAPAGIANGGAYGGGGGAPRPNGGCSMKPRPRPRPRACPWP